MRSRSNVSCLVLFCFGVATTSTSYAQSSNSTTPSGATLSTNEVRSSESSHGIASEGVSPLPPLDVVLSLAHAKAPEMISAKAEAGASRSAMVGARMSSIQNPYLEVIGERGTRGVTNDVYLTAQLHTPIEVAGQRSRRISEASSYIGWRDAVLGQNRAELLGYAARVYGDCVTGAVRYNTLIELRDSAIEEARALGQRRDVGDATERDAQLAELERARISVQVEEVRAELGAAHAELTRLTGRRFAISQGVELFPSVNLDRPPAYDAKKAPSVQSSIAEARYHDNVDIRLERERIPPVSVILQGGRGDFGETRLGAGVGWTFPVSRYNQGERARAQAEAERARKTANAYRDSIDQRIDAIVEEARHLRVAFESLERDAIPAAASATAAATRMQQAGKTDLMSVIVARRDFLMLRLRRLDLAARAWSLMGQWIRLTGELPKR